MFTTIKIQCDGNPNALEDLIKLIETATPHMVDNVVVTSVTGDSALKKVRFAYFAKHEKAGWVAVSTNCSGEDTAFYDQHFTSASGYIRTRIVTLD